MLAVIEDDAVSSLALYKDIDENPRLGFKPKNTASYLGCEWSNAETALGIEPVLRWEGSGPRYTGKERDSES
ncbi:MAG: hypothetical protein ACREP9_21405, partial [Candidatus Dormibacteraceae bacterium]